MSLRLSPERYLECIDADTARMAEVAVQGLDAPVPPCPGWTVGEAVRHTASVYWHKVMTMRLGRRPDEGEWPNDPDAGQGLVEWLLSAHGALRDELVRRGPDAPSATWWPPEQTVGFWYRRMAHEVAIHRADVESGHGAVTALAGDLAVDGVDEVLRLFAQDDAIDEADVPPEASGQRVAVEASGNRWLLSFGSKSLEVAGDGDSGGVPDATVRGSASDVDLWLWNRPSVGVVEVAGTEMPIRVLRAWMALTTQ